jgi:hypothetical protein
VNVLGTNVPSWRLIRNHDWHGSDWLRDHALHFAAGVAIGLATGLAKLELRNLKVTVNTNGRKHLTRMSGIRYRVVAHLQVVLTHGNSQIMRTYHNISEE